MKAFLRPHRFRHPYPVRFYTTKTHSGHERLWIAAVQTSPWNPFRGAQIPAVIWSDTPPSAQF